MHESYHRLYEKIEDLVSLDQFFFLILIYQQDWEFLKIIRQKSEVFYDSIIRSLEVKRYIKWHGDNVEDIALRDRGNILFKKFSILDKSNKKQLQIKMVEKWIDDWRKLFPKGSNTGGYLYRGNRLECLKKMSKFVASYPYTREEIFKATENYVKKFEIKGYNYMMQAHYFIDKRDVGSTLSAECEALRDKSNNTNQQDIYGGKVI